MNDVYEIADYAARDKQWAARILQEAISEGLADRAEVAQIRLGTAIAFLRALAPGARVVQFRTGADPRDTAYRYAVVLSFDGEPASEMDFGDFPAGEDPLASAEDYLAVAAENGAEFEEGEQPGEFRLQLLR